MNNPDAAGLRHAIRDAVERRTEHLPATPAPWPHLQRLHRRNTRIRRIALVSTLVGLVAVILGTLGPARILITPRPGPAAPNRLLGEATLGTLADDPAWTAALLRRADQQLGSGAAERVVFADDIDGTRVALVRLHDPSGSHLFVWFTGPTHAVATDMSAGTGGDPSRAYGLVLPPTSTDPQHATLLVVGPSGGRITVWTNNDVAPDGQQISDVVTAGEIAPGIYTVRLTIPFPQTVVRLKDTPGGEWVSAVTGPTGYVPNPPRLTDAQWWARSWSGARGSATATPPTGLFVQQAYDTLALRSDIRGARVLWVQPRTGSPRVVLLLRAPSGGSVVVALYAYGLPSNEVGATIEAVALAPAGNPNQLAIAWYLTTQPDPNGPRQATDQLALLGPSAATTARITSADGSTRTVHLDQGAAITAAPRAVSVTFLDAAGHTLHDTTISPQWNTSSGVLSHQK